MFGFHTQPHLSAAHALGAIGDTTLAKTMAAAKIIAANLRFGLRNAFPYLLPVLKRVRLATVEGLRKPAPESVRC